MSQFSSADAVTSQPAANKPIDGRIARGLRTRESVVKAFEELISRGGPMPTAAQVATRAGVSCRSIFTHFGDMDGVVCAVACRLVDRLRALHQPISSELELGERLSAFVSQRARALDEITPLFRTAMMQGPPSDRMKEILGKGEKAGRSYTLSVFERELDRLPEPARSEVAEAVIATTAWPHWDGMRRYQILSAETARAVMRRELQALLSTAH